MPSPPALPVTHVVISVDVLVEVGIGNAAEEMSRRGLSSEDDGEDGEADADEKTIVHVQDDGSGA